MEERKWLSDDPLPSTLPLSERILDRLGDIMLASDEILEMVEGTPSLGFVRRGVRKVYDDVNELMKQLAD